MCLGASTVLVHVKLPCRGIDFRELLVILVWPFLPSCLMDCVGTIVLKWDTIGINILLLFWLGFSVNTSQILKLLPRRSPHNIAWLLTSSSMYCCTSACIMLNLTWCFALLLQYHPQCQSQEWKPWGCWTRVIAWAWAASAHLMMHTFLSLSPTLQIQPPLPKKLLCPLRNFVCSWTHALREYLRLLLLTKVGVL